ncbi:MAG: hypothetical protein JXQ91_20065 [Vannielia sp.]|uniref:hypothetical protein n=1 Tax=Vannielia sp. TaxID=2813045 RepID=UPI003B8CCBB8
MDWISSQWTNFKCQLRSKNPLLVGRALTKAFAIFVALLLLLPQHHDGHWSWRLTSFLLAPPNELGDTLAGIAGVLAFLWIIVTVWLQSQELAAQREELSLARIESAKMASAMEAQTEVFLEEQRQRAEARVDATISALLEEVLALVAVDQLGYPEWKRVLPDGESMGESTHRHLSTYLGNERDLDSKLVEVLHKSIPYSISELRLEIEMARVEELPERPIALSDLRHRLLEILTATQDASSAMKSRLRKIRLIDAHEAIDAFIRDGSFWKDTGPTP